MGLKARLQEYAAEIGAEEGLPSGEIEERLAVLRRDLDAISSGPPAGKGGLTELMRERRRREADRRQTEQQSQFLREATRRVLQGYLDVGTAHETNQARPIRATGGQQNTRDQPASGAFRYPARNR